jgi:hypothetical protein
LNVTSIVPVADVTGAGSDDPEKVVPEKLPSTGADVVLPPKTFTKSYPASVPNAENVSVTAELLWMSQEHCKLAV